MIYTLGGCRLEEALFYFETKLGFLKAGSIKRSEVRQKEHEMYSQCLQLQNWTVKAAVFTVYS